MFRRRKVLENQSEGLEDKLNDKDAKIKKLQSELDETEQMYREVNPLFLLLH